MKYIQDGPWLILMCIAGVVALVAVVILWPFKKSKHMEHDDVYE